MRPRTVVWGAVVAAVVGLSTLLTVAAPDSSAQPPTVIAATPRLAATGTPVTVSGGGCSTAVRITATRYLFPGLPTVSLDTNVAPAADGSWQTAFPMPAEPAYVIAQCGGVASTPLVVAPSDIAHGRNALVRTTATQIIITAPSAIDGTDFTVFDRSGTLLGQGIARAGTAEVRIPRALGGQLVLGLALAPPVNTGLPDPFVPRVWEYLLPLGADTTLALTPRVASAGTVVSASGTCAGTPRLIVTGRALGWFDVRPVFVDAIAITGPSSSWTATFPMPAIPSGVTLECTSGPASGTANSTIGPPLAGIALAGHQTVPGAMTITIDIPPGSAAPYEAFSSSGEPLTLGQIGTQLEIDVSARPAGIVIFGTLLFGENAEARQVATPQAWFLDLGGATSPPRPTPTPGVVPTPDGPPAPGTTPPPGAGPTVVPMTLDTPVAPRPQPTAPGSGVADQPTLAFTGIGATATLGWIGMGLCGAGTAAVLASRRLYPRG